MSENVISNEAIPQADENFADNAQTTEKEIFVPVKFNKQVLNLNLEKAQELAQKGMKFDAIRKDYDALRSMAQQEGKSVCKFLEEVMSQRFLKRQNEILEKCGGDQEFAEHILELEKGNSEEIKGFSELKDNFPKIKGIEDLPESVVDAAKLKGTLLLDEYLRYLHKQDTQIKKSIKTQRDAQDSAMGPLMSKNGDENPETAEFLKGLWRN